MLGFIEMSGGVVAGIAKITAAIKACTVAKLADKLETMAIIVLYAQDFIMKMAQGTAELAKQAAQFVKNTAVKIADTAARWAMTAATAAWNAICTAATAATTALGAAFAFLTSPIGLVTLAIGAVIAIGILLYKNWDVIKEAAGKLADWLLEKWEFIKEKTGDFLNKVKETWDKTWAGLKSTVEDIFGGIWGFIKNTINSILGGVEAMANGIVNAINTVIRALNSVSFTVPEWLKDVPLAKNFAGKSFGFNLQELGTVKIPRLADGAVIRGGNPFMAVLGDQPADVTNIETPLPTMVQAFKQAIRETGIGKQGSNTFVFQVEGKTFFEITRTEAERFYQSTGISPYPI